jgi:hypothetical protein
MCARHFNRRSAASDSNVANIAVTPRQHTVVDNMASARETGEGGSDANPSRRLIDSMVIDSRKRSEAEEVDVVGVRSDLAREALVKELG